MRYIWAFFLAAFNLDALHSQTISLNDVMDLAQQSGQSEIVLPPGEYSVTDTIVRSGPLTITGYGWQTQILPGPDGICFDLTSPPGKDRQPGTESPPEKSQMGIRLTGLHFRGVRGTGQTGIIWRGHCDEIFCESLRFENLDQAMTCQPAKNGRVFIRESTYQNIIVYDCGTDDLPAVDLFQEDTGVPQDGNNHLSLINWRVVRSRNVGLRIADESSKAVARFVSIDGMMAHGSQDKNRPSGPVILIEGSIWGIQIDGLRGTAFADAIVRVQAIGKETPRVISIRGQVSGQSPGIDLREVEDCIVDVQSFNKKTSPVSVSDRCVNVRIR